MQRFLVLLSLILTACATTDVESLDERLDQPKPEFPGSELVRGREGWVVLNFSVTDRGKVTGTRIIESSGSEAFDSAALDAVQRWQFDPSESQYDSSVLVDFVFERSLPRVTRQFSRRYRHINNLIDKGELADASQNLEKLSGKRLHPTEVAYVWIAKARLADVMGNKDAQLDYFRKAMISDGRWVERRQYLNLLRATTILGLQAKDYASAVRDYDKLMDSPLGRELAADLAPAIASARSMTGADLPYLTAKSRITVKGERRSRGSGHIVWRQWPSDLGSYPKPNNLPSKPEPPAQNQT